MDSDDPPSHLTVVVDLHPAQWKKSSLPSNPQPLPFSSFLSQILVFLNSHLASKHENTLAVIGALADRSMMLYSSLEAPEQTEAPTPDANSYQPFRLVDSTISKRIQEGMEKTAEGSEQNSRGLVGALTKALCYVNRLIQLNTIVVGDGSAVRNSSSQLAPRILVISVSPDLSSSYIPLMNSIFAAQKLKVTIDVCKVFGPDTVFLQQAAHLTGGSYVYLERRDALLQYLTMCFLPSPSLRRVLALPTQDKVDFRAACFCHKNIVDIGYVCSVCLSIFCKPIPVCSTCRTKFPIKTLQRFGFGRPAALNGAGMSRGTSIAPS
ncbi:RNA polymerase II transcription factor B subunit 4 [Tulasnella sp. 419]|nr:RNA polymerase II transcription factor B subunit 4 [Tulasnella sp. 419]